MFWHHFGAKIQSGGLASPEPPPQRSGKRWTVQHLEIAAQFSTELAQFFNTILKSKFTKDEGIYLLDEVPCRFWRVIAQRNPNALLHMFNDCFRKGRFPGQWKDAGLVILHKPGKPEDAVSSYHCYACWGRTVVAVSIDVRNAFNSMPWRSIQRALVEKEFPEWLRCFVRLYLGVRLVMSISFVKKLIWLWLLYLLLRLQMTFHLGLDATKNTYVFKKRFKRKWSKLNFV